MKNTRIQDIAQQAGVSCATVSRVFNHKHTVKSETYKRVMKIAHEIGYTGQAVKKNERSGDATIIVVALPVLGDTFFGSIIEGVQSSAHRHNCSVMLSQELCECATADQAISLCRAISARGLILLRSCMPESEILKLNKSMDLVQCCDYYDDTPVSWVAIDDYRAAYEMTSYLISTGRKKVAFIACPYDTGGRVIHVKRREQGFRKAVLNSGITPNEEWIINVSASSYNQAFSATTQLLSCTERPNAIFAASDYFAAAAINATKQCALRVPEDIIISGFDNTIISRMIDPPITTLSQPCHQIGYIACERLFDKITGGQLEPQHIQLDTELIIRRSTTVSIDAK